MCDQGCAIEAVELVREPDEAKTLCKGLPSPATLPPVDSGATLLKCPDQGDRFWCHQNVVYACPESSAVEVAICTNGCAAEDETLADPSVDIATATTVMCRHDAGVTRP